MAQQGGFAPQSGFAPQGGFAQRHRPEPAAAWPDPHDDVGFGPAPTNPMYRPPANNGVFEEEERREKMDLLNEIGELKKQGGEFTKEWRMNSNIDEMKLDLYRVREEVSMKQKIETGKAIAVGAAQLIERLVDQFRLRLRLKRWSRSVQVSYPQTLAPAVKRLIQKWNKRITLNMPPELEIVFGFFFSMLMYHVTKWVGSKDSFLNNASREDDDNEKPNSGVHITEATDDAVPPPPDDSEEIISIPLPSSYTTPAATVAHDDAPSAQVNTPPSAQVNTPRRPRRMRNAPTPIQMLA
jgi:hypothetical protein